MTKNIMLKSDSYLKIDFLDIFLFIIKIVKNDKNCHLIRLFYV